MQGASSVAVGGMADIALASEARGSGHKDSMLTQAHSQETGRERPSSIQNEPRRLKRIKALHWQTTARGNFDLQRLSGALANPIRHLLRVASADRPIVGTKHTLAYVLVPRSFSLVFERRIRYLLTLRTRLPTWRTS